MFARTPRLTLRPGWPEDADALTQAIAHESVALKLARLPWPYTQAHAAEWLSIPRAPTDASFVILSHEHDYPRLIGGIGLTPGEGGTELGYWLTPEAWGRGYATEAARAVIDMARHALGLKRLVSGHFIDNPASGRVLRKLGFHEVGRTPRFNRTRGHDVECVLFDLDLDQANRMGDFQLAA